MAIKPKVYIDSCGFIDMAKHKIGKNIGTGRENDVWYLKKILEAAKNGDIEVYTSTLTVAECTHADGDISEDVKNLFRAILTSGQYVRLVQPDQFVAEDARDLRWKHDISLKGADGIHVASALSMGCKELITTDDEQKKISDKPKIEALGLKILSASDTQLLPGKYLQRTIENLSAEIDGNQKA